MSKSNKENKPVVVKPKVAKPKSEGCDNCKNTGLEQGVSRDTAQVCPICNGSPFESIKLK